MARSDGILPFGFAIEHSLVPARQNVQDAFELGGSRLELFCAPLLAWLRVLVLELLVDEGDACHEVVRRRDARVDKLPSGAVDPEPVDEEIRSTVDLLVQPLLSRLPLPLREYLVGRSGLGSRLVLVFASTIASACSGSRPRDSSFSRSSLMMSSCSADVNCSSITVSTIS